MCSNSVDKSELIFPMERCVNQTVWFRFMDEIMNESEKFSNRILDSDIFTLKPYDWSDEDDNEWHFYHKPSGLKIQWYKYPLRSPTANMTISHEQFYAVVVDCYNTYWTNKKVIYSYGLAGKWWEIKMIHMTEKQKEFIKDICDVLKIDFDDCKNFSKMEASKFISDNIKEYKLVCEEMFDAYHSWAVEHGYD